MYVCKRIKTNPGSEYNNQAPSEHNKAERLLGYSAVDKKGTDFQ